MFRETKHAALNQREELEKMARRRFQDPTPFREGGFWWILFYQDHFSNGVRTRKRTRKKLAPVTTLEREAKKIAAEFLRPQNQGLVTLGSATPFTHYVESVYIPTVLPLMAKSTQERYGGVIKNYLVPAFGSACLRDFTPLSVQQYFSAQRNSKLAHASLDKIRDVLSSIMGSAKTYGMLVTNPVEGVRLPPAKRGKRRKPFLTPAQFTSLLPLLPEPYATMVFVATYTGLRVSELIGLRWKNVHADAITVEERYCRGDWGQPKSQASNATIAVNRAVIERIQQLKGKTVRVKAGHATRTYSIVKTCGPDDLVFQSVTKGRPMRDNSILVRYLKPAGRKLGIEWLNWRSLRTSHATWLKMVGADVKDAQAQMRHSRASTTMDIYTQFTPESQRLAVDKLSSLTAAGRVE